MRLVHAFVLFALIVFSNSEEKDFIAVSIAGGASGGFHVVGT